MGNVGEDWSPEEVGATVADYLAMLAHELRGESYSKRAHNRQLQAILRNRSAGAIEFKHANISAVLIELGFPYIDGYKPRANYLELLRDEVVYRLDANGDLASAAALAAEAPAPPVPVLRTIDDILVPAPHRERRKIADQRRPTPVPRRNTNYLEREARNASLGAAGERFTLAFEHRRLWEGGHRHLAERIEHVSETQGDGLGFDIHSFDDDGRDRLIEVKTTKFGEMTPFFASRTEVRVSEEKGERFHLYRVFSFSEKPRIFVLPGSLKQSCVLDPVEYRATVV
jgi:hypothetical protein